MIITVFSEPTNTVLKKYMWHVTVSNIKDSGITLKKNIRKPEEIIG